MNRGVLAASLLLTAGSARAQFAFRPAGELVAGSGRGRSDMANYAPGMRFPIESAPAWANSQVWGRGGSNGPGGGQCDAQNYSYPWRDNYCESRSWTMPMCPASTGHQGQDIRPATCRNDVHWCVSAAAGTVTSIGSYSVYVTTEDGIRYDYLHMASVQVRVGQRVTRGQRLGRVSNAFGGTPTTIHLHFNINRAVMGFGMVYAPTYGALVDAYQRLLTTGTPTDAGLPRDVVDVATPTDVVDVATPTDVVDVATATDAVDVATTTDVVDVAIATDVVDVTTTTDVVDVAATTDAVDATVRDAGGSTEEPQGCGCAVPGAAPGRGLACFAALVALRRRRHRWASRRPRSVSLAR